MQQAVPHVEPCRVAAYQNPLGPQARGQVLEDLLVSDRKVVVLDRSRGGGLGGRSGGNEFQFDAVHPASTPTADVAADALGPLVDALCAGVNGILFVLGSSASGHQELIEGSAAQPDDVMGAGAARWSGLAEAMVEAVYAQLSAAGATGFSLRLQLLNLNEDRLQNLLQPDCHAHDLPLHEVPFVSSSVP